MDEETGIGPEYTVPTVSLGVVPSVVYRIVAPDVVVEIVTLCADVYVSGGGEKIGTSTAVPGFPPPPPPHPTHSIAMITQASLLKKISLVSWVHVLFDGNRRPRAASRLPACRDGSAIVLRDYESKMQNESIGSMKTCQSRAINTIHAKPFFHPEIATCLHGVCSPRNFPAKSPV